MFDHNVKDLSFREDFYRQVLFYQESHDFTPDLTTKVPPSCEEAEEAIIGGLFSRIHKVVEMLEVPDEVFFFPHLRLLFKTLKYLARQNPEDFTEKKEVDEIAEQKMSLMILLKEIIHSYDLGDTLSIFYCMDLESNLLSCSSRYLENSVRIVLDKYYRRKMLENAVKIQSYCYDPMTPLQEILENTKSMLDFVANGTAKVEGFSDMAETLSSIFDAYNAAARGEVEAYIQTGVYDFDTQLGGGLPVGLHILGARPSMGKSAFALNVAYGVAKQGASVAYYSLEMSKDDLVRRLISAETRIPTEQMLKATISEDKIPTFLSTAEELSELPLYIYDRPRLSVTELRSSLINLYKAKASTNNPLKLAVIDYVGLFEEVYQHGGDSRTAMARISRSIKNLSAELGIPIILLSQLNRQCESRNDKRPILADLRETGALEQDADLVYFLYRDEYYNHDSIDAGTMEVIVRKYRNGQTGSVKVGYDKPYTRVYNLAYKKS